MNARHWILIACLVAGLGCGGDDAAADSGTSVGGKGGTGGMGVAGSGGSGGSSVTGSGGSSSGGSGGSGGTGASGSSTSGSGGSGGGNSTDCAWEQDNQNDCNLCANDTSCGAPKYTDNMDGTVTWPCCGLVWQQVVDDKGSDGTGRYTWVDAKTYCAGLALAGGGWRLPTIEELWSLVVIGQTPREPTIDRTAFPNAPSDFFWSSSVYVGEVNTAWLLNFNDHYSDYDDISDENRVRCVR